MALWLCFFMLPAHLVHEISFFKFDALCTAPDDRSLKMVRRQTQRNRPAPRKIMKKNPYCSVQSNRSPVLRTDYERKGVVRPQETLAHHGKTRSEDTCTYCNALMFQVLDLHNHTKFHY
ncbi:uncharacterized protein B0I36DRAFT_355902 [Microdochium trichocladiopsis]|uniref:C2H2-type domain-containing protein n=1 Tax=Microdochium trichocladiopsis TaxID=1682393 RepID=A0A9P8XRB8_9PEZI|nr:uncharacterized protein B0I36DRAFT_355902 [Microdochium trichocladiopsis]KAH7012497.1 hypothetical protein B0I36DRAFT_355902 [Microdochium trichocladiopsis]